MVSGGRMVGLNEPQSMKLTLKTILGAAKTMDMSNIHPAKLREMVCSPGGTTLAGLSVLSKRGFPEALEAAIKLQEVHMSLLTNLVFI
jgi:pyrroline-5-carboxylate reductase